MERVLAIKSGIKSKAYMLGFIQVILGSLFLALMALVKIPLYPTPVTLQTLAVFILALSLGSKKGAMACALYLVEASLGAPVLSGGISNPLWMIGCNAGFLISFPIAAFVIGFMLEKIHVKTFFKVVGCILCGQFCIDVLGLSGLSLFFGVHKAFALGCMPFVPNMIIKVLLAASVYSPIVKVQKKYFC
ncbi:MAG: biotin transporter BioY [Chlamydiota bacterium]